MSLVGDLTRLLNCWL